MDNEKIIDKFRYIEYGEGNIEVIYRNNLKLYKYHQSDKQYIPVENLVLSNGIIQNELPIASNSFDGFHIEEIDFKLSELGELKLIDESLLNYGLKQKYTAYKEYIEFKIEFPNWYHIANRNGFYALKRSELPKFKKAISSGYFKNVHRWKNDDNSINKFHYTKLTRDWLEQRDTLLKSNKNLEVRLKLLLDFNAVLKVLMDDTARFFSVVDRYDGKEIAYINSFNIDKSDILQTLENIKNYSQSINHNINTGHYKIALEIQHYCCLMFEDIRGFLSSRLLINIDRSPLKKDFDDVLKKLQDSIDLQKLDFLLRVGGVSKDATGKDSEFILKEKDTILITPKSRIVFEKFCNIYKGELTGQQSNFSFLFYAMKKFHLLNCSTARYITFCNANNIKINTVVSTKKYENLDKSDSLIQFFDEINSEHNNDSIQ